MKKGRKAMNQKAVIAMSGGVDSSVAAYLMKEKDMSVLELRSKPLMKLVME